MPKEKLITVSTKVDEKTKETIDFIIEDTNLGSVSNFVKAAIEEYIKSLIPDWSKDE